MPDAVLVTVLINYQAGGGANIQRVHSAVRLWSEDDAWPPIHADAMRVAREVAKVAVEEEQGLGHAFDATLIGITPLTRAPEEDLGYDCDIQPDYSDPVTKLILARDEKEQKAKRQRAEAQVEARIGQRVEEGIRETIGYVAANLARDAEVLMSVKDLDPQDAMMQATRADTLRAVSMAVSRLYGPHGWQPAVERIVKVPTGPPEPEPEEPRRRRGLFGG